MGTNRERATWARNAFEAYTRETYNGKPESIGFPELENAIDGEEAIDGDADAATAFSDFLCDLMHLARAYGLDWEKETAAGRYHYEVESRYGWDEEVPA